jgi:RNA polymerase sigma-70 factor (ECF subfamily)
MMEWMLAVGGALEPHVVNGQPGAVLRDRDGQVVNVWSVDVLGGRISMIRAVLNPEKLGHVGTPADPWAFLAEEKAETRGRRTR